MHRWGAEGGGALEAGQGAANGEARPAHESHGGGTPADGCILRLVAIRAALQRVRSHRSFQFLQPFAHLRTAHRLL